MRKMKSLSLLLLALLVFSPVASSVEAAPATGHRGLDPTPLVEWFGATVTSGFRDPARPYHVGIDFGVGWGAPIPAAWEGAVVHAGWYGDFGNTVIVQNDDWQMRYCHLSRFAVSVGQQVRTGTIIGYSGNTGKSTGAHLHYEVRYQGVAVDPMTAPGVASEARPAGDFIRLRIHGHVTSDLWTVVQLQAADGTWHNVESWQGTPDIIEDGVGLKTWWIYPVDRGFGPFRWVVYQHQHSHLLTTTAPFFLPSDDGRAVVVATWLP